MKLSERLFWIVIAPLAVIVLVGYSLLLDSITLSKRARDWFWRADHAPH
jgi:hypothetical protein